MDLTRADRPRPRLRRRLGEGDTRFRRRAPQGIRHDQGADGRQGIQGPPHPRREGRRGEGDHRALQKGEKFEKLAERSKDPGSKANGGDLDWNAPGNFVKPFSDAMVKLPKGKFTTVPVQTQFGWHVIEVDDIREAKVPPFDEVKPQLQQRMQGQQLDLYFRELRAKNGM